MSYSVRSCGGATGRWPTARSRYSCGSGCASTVSRCRSWAWGRCGRSTRAPTPRPTRTSASASSSRTGGCCCRGRWRYWPRPWPSSCSSGSEAPWRTVHSMAPFGDFGSLSWRVYLRRDFGVFTCVTQTRKTQRPGPGQHPHAAGAQRRQVAVLFADISGFTRLVESVDPETVYQVVRPLMDELALRVRLHDGEIQQILGDGFMAVFGLRHAH